MYQTLIPLDIIWLDSNRNIVEIAANAQPCKTQASKCPQYGGNRISSYVIEIPVEWRRNSDCKWANSSNGDASCKVTRFE